MQKKFLILICYFGTQTMCIQGAALDEGKLAPQPKRRYSLVKRDIGPVTPEEQIFYDRYWDVFRLGYKLHVEGELKPIAAKNLGKRAIEEGASEEFAERMKQLYADRIACEYGLWE